MNKGNLCLLLAAIIWGFSLVSQKDGMEVMGPWSFTAVRCTLGGIALLPLVLYTEKKKKKSNPDYSSRKDTVKTILPSILCALFLEGTIMTQQYGLLYTEVGKGAFITAFYIFITPVTGLFLKKKVSGRIWVAVALAMAGLYMITMTGGFKALNTGDVLMFVAAFCYSFYLHVVDGCGHCDTVKLSCIQFFVIGLSSWIGAMIFEPGDITWGNCMISILPILYAGVVSASGGFTFQMIGQKYTDPNTASLILSSETVFSLLAGWICFHEILTGMEYLGCAVMTVAIVLAVLPGKQKQ